MISGRWKLFEFNLRFSSKHDQRTQTIHHFCAKPLPSISVGSNFYIQKSVDLTSNGHSRLANTEDMFVLCHLGVPRIEWDQWFLTIDGMVERPRTYRFDDLMGYPKIEVVSIHQCCGSPFSPFEPTRRVCNVRWGGIRLLDLLADCRPSTECS